MHVCKYCNKEFQKESTLVVHACEQKRRALQESDTGVRFGFMAYNRFIELTQGASKKKTYAEFCTTPYYSAFVKFGQYIVSVQAVNPAQFIDWIIKSGKKLDWWTKSQFYDEYLYQYLRTENPQDAIERSMNTMVAWATEAEEPFNHFFMKCSKNRVCQLINNGRVSPWVVFNCDSGVEFLGSLSAGQLELIYVIIDPEYWQAKFKKYDDDTKWIKDVLKAADL